MGFNLQQKLALDSGNSLLGLGLRLLGKPRTRIPVLGGGGSSGPPAASQAAAFIAIAGITDPTQQSAVNTLAAALEAAGLWAKLQAIYPFVGGNAAAHKFNLKDPRDADAAFRILWAGTVTHSANGVQGDGATGYGDTKFTPNPNFADSASASLGVYSRTGASPSNGYFMASVVSANGQEVALATTLGSTNIFADVNGFSGSVIVGGQPANTGDGFFIASRTAANLQSVYKNGVLKGTATMSEGDKRPTASIFIMARNANGGVDKYVSQQAAFAFIGGGFNDADAVAFNTIVQAYQTTLARNV